METFADVAVLLIDGNQGIYLPQQWALYVVSNDIRVKGLDKADFKILLNGPKTHGYFEVWSDFQDEIIMQDSNGDEWNLHEESDLWMYPSDVEIDWSIN